MKRGILARILLSLLGSAFILWGVGSIVLGVAGEPASAVITSIRREGGERTDGKPGRYTYNISYTFTLPDGKEINGFAKKIGDSVYLKAKGTSMATVRYVKFAPFINTLEDNTRFSLGQPILMCVGVLLIILVNQKK